MRACLKYQNDLIIQYRECMETLLNDYNKECLLDIPEAIIYGNGKMFRSLLALYVFLAYSDKSCNDNILAWAVSFDILQTFILMHDDIIDSAQIRRGYPVPDKSLALVLGDILYSYGLKKFMYLDTDEEIKIKALNEMLNIAMITGFGELSDQALSISRLGEITEQEIQDVYKKKTAMYSFVLPLKCGAILGGASTADVSLLEEVGEFIGVAFQYMDDVADFFMKKEKTGKTEMNDLAMKKVNIVLVESYKNFSGGKEEYLKILNSRNKIKKLLNEQKIKQRIVLRINNLVSKGLEKLSKTTLSNSNKELISSLILDLIFLNKAD